MGKVKAKKRDRLAYSVKGLAVATTISRNKIYEAMKKGELKAKKVDDRTIILRKEAIAWLDSLPDYKPKSGNVTVLPENCDPNQLDLFDRAG